MGVEDDTMHTGGRPRLHRDVRIMLMTEAGAIGIVLRSKFYGFLTFGLFVPLLLIYLFTLPATYTGGVVGLISLRYLNTELIFFSIALAGFLSLTLSLNIFAFRASVLGRGRKLGVGAILASLLPSSVCCTSLVPSLLAVLGASTPQIFGLTGRIQGIFATYEIAFLGAALVLVVFSLRLAAKNILQSCPIPERRVPAI